MNLRPIEILMVEDNDGDILLTTRALKEAKVANRLHIAHDGVEALEFLRRQGLIIALIAFAAVAGMSTLASSLNSAFTKVVHEARVVHLLTRGGAWQCRECRWGARWGPESRS